MGVARSQSESVWTEAELVLTVKKETRNFYRYHHNMVAYHKMSTKDSRHLYLIPM